MAKTNKSKKLLRLADKVNGLNPRILEKHEERIALEKQLLAVKHEISDLANKRASLYQALRRIPLCPSEILRPSEFSIPIQDLGFSERTREALLLSNITTLGDILDYSEPEILQLHILLGRKSLGEIKAVISVFGFSLKPKRSIIL